MEVEPNVGAPNVEAVVEVAGLENADDPNAGALLVSGVEVAGFENAEDPNAGALLVADVENAELPKVEGLVVAGFEVEV